MAQKEPVKEVKETPKKVQPAGAQVSTKDRAVKTGDSTAKKHWFDLFRAQQCHGGVGDVEKKRSRV